MDQTSSKVFSLCIVTLMTQLNSVVGTNGRMMFLTLKNVRKAMIFDFYYNHIKITCIFATEKALAAIQIYVNNIYSKITKFY